MLFLTEEEARSQPPMTAAIRVTGLPCEGLRDGTAQNRPAAG
jgi:hypothetical protein